MRAQLLSLCQMFKHFDVFQASTPHFRNQSRLVAAASADRSARNGQRRYKIKRRLDGAAGFQSSTPARPSSAIDFADESAPNQGMMRPHSVMGPYPGDSRNRVIQVSYNQYT